MAEQNEEFSAEMSTGSPAIKHDPEHSTATLDVEPDNDSMNNNMTFPQFGCLPPELCLMILEERLTAELIPPVRTLTILYLQPHLLTRGTRYEDRGLWHTGNNLLRGEIERSSILLPSRQLTHQGTTMYFVDKGLTSLSCEQHREMGVRPTPKRTVFYMVYETALRVFTLIQDKSIDARELEWLGSLLLDYQTLRGLARQSSTEGSRGGQVGLVQLLQLLPNLRVLYIGFARRWMEVVLVEGPVAADVLVPVQVPEISQGDIDKGSSPRWYVEAPDGVQLHEGLKAMIVAAASESMGEIRALETAGIEVRLVVVQDEGIVRRLDVIRGFNILDL